MKVYDIVPENEYTCMQCSKNFTSKKVFAFFWFDADKCRIKYAFRTIKGFYPQAKRMELLRRTKWLAEQIK